jgi:hypothetical protein
MRHRWQTTVASQRADARAPQPARRGRPLQVRPTFPADRAHLTEGGVHALGTLHRDPGWAIVQLVERHLSAGQRRPQSKRAAALAELVHLSKRRALIVVHPEAFKRLRCVSTIPLTDGRALLAFDHRGGLADLEVAILDQMEVAPARSSERAQLIQARDIVRA